MNAKMVNVQPLVALMASAVEVVRLHARLIHVIAASNRIARKADVQRRDAQSHLGVVAS